MKEPREPAGGPPSPRPTLEPPWGQALTWLWLWLWGSPGGIFSAAAAAATRLASPFHAVGNGCWLLQVLGAAGGSSVTVILPRFQGNGHLTLATSCVPRASRQPHVCSMPSLCSCSSPVSNPLQPYKLPKPVTPSHGEETGSKGAVPCLGPTSCHGGAPGSSQNEQGCLRGLAPTGGGGRALDL